MPEPAAFSVLAFDFGVRRIGVASGNTMTGSATPAEIIDTEINELRFKRIAELIALWNPQVLVVGIPCHPDGTPHELTQRCQRFSNQLRGRYALPVETVDERYSSAVIESSAVGKSAVYKTAAGAVRRKPVDDQAAAVILQQYFDELASGARALPMLSVRLAPSSLSTPFSPSSSSSSSSSPSASTPVATGKGSPISGVNQHE